MKTRDFPVEFKAKDSGAFEGYAAVFGNLDQGFDVIEEGAFKEFARTRDEKTIVLYQHRIGEPIGKADVSQDAKGLAFVGQLVLEDPIAKRAYIHMKAGTIDAMSIGFDVLSGGAEFTEGGARRLRALKLWELSVVTFGMNELARIDSVKNRPQITTIREYEDLLRDACGFSAAQAKRLASDGWKALQSSRDDDDQTSVQPFADVLGLLNRPLTV
jgi:HK97 family phage prohead protease